MLMTGSATACPSPLPAEEGSDTEQMRSRRGCNIVLPDPHHDDVDDDDDDHHDGYDDDDHHDDVDDGDDDYDSDSDDYYEPKFLQPTRPALTS